MKFERQKGFRIHRYFCGITSFSGLVWNGFKWVEASEPWISTHAPCRTVRAFRRHLRKHPEIRGKAVLASRFRGHDVYA